MADNNQSHTRSWLVEVLSCIFLVFENISAYTWIIRCVKRHWLKEKRQRGWIAEVYVSLINLPLSIIAFFFFPAIAWWGLYRSFFEIWTNQINFLFFDEHRERLKNPTKRPPIRSFKRAIFLVFISYIEIVFWFAAAYKLIPGAFQFDQTFLNYWTCENLGYWWSQLGLFYSSFLNTITFGTALIITPKTIWGAVFLLSQALISFLMVMIILVSFINLLPERISDDPTEGDLSTKPPSAQP
ncbi:MAG: hypothetical protein C4570_05040 [Ammonifex sp.]|nr:MAG: hypothetical protein C4570_05040 [Ammonifex sp.]